MYTYFFLLGTTPLLSKAELKVLTAQENLEEVASDFISLKLDSDETALKLLNTTGGLVKALRLQESLEVKSQDEIYEVLESYLIKTEAKINFAISEYGKSELSGLSSQDLKKKLRESGISARYIESPSRGLSAAILIHQKNVQELNIIYDGEMVYFATTLGVQDIDNWTKIDRSKPYADRKKGMLAPKIARIMVNLAGKDLDIINSNKVLYDPFCGTGTVLMEALLRGYKVAGSDLDQKAFLGTQKNLEWLSREYDLEINSNIFMSDVCGVSEFQLKGKVDLIVTEPFLGKPSPQTSQLETIFSGLEKLYLGAFKTWTKILKDEAKVVIVFPYVDSSGVVFSLEKIIDKLAEKGYTPLVEPIFYSRPGAIVQRQIMIFEFKNLK